MTILHFLKTVFQSNRRIPNVDTKICRYSTKHRRFYNKITNDFSQEEIANILHCMNSLSYEVMSLAFAKSFYMSTICEEICRNREYSGPIYSLNELTDVKDLGPKRLLKLCEKFKHGSNHVHDNLCTEVKKPKSVKDSNKYLKYFSPKLTAESLKSVRDVTSLQISRDGTNFSTVDRDLRLTSWGFVPLSSSTFQQSPLNMSNADILEEAHRVVSHLPKSSHYLIESRSHYKLNQNYIRLYMYVIKFQMAVQALLNTDLPSTGQHRLYHVKDRFTKQLFNLDVDSERVSCHHILLAMEDGSIKHNLKVTEDMWEKFNDLSQGIEKERYANCLLVAHGFCSAVINSTDPLIVPQEDTEDERT